MKPFRTYSTALALSLALFGCQSGEQKAQPDDQPAVEHPTQDHPGAEEHHHGAEGHRGHADGEPQPHGHRFDNPEEWAERWNAPERDAWQKPAEVIDIMGLAEGMTVVDLGAGTGYFVEQMAPVVTASGEVLALDIEQSMVDYVNEKAAEQGLEHVEARKVAVDDPQLEAGSVDRILTVNTWHHIPGRVAYAEKLRDALEPGGKVVVVDYTMEADQGPPKKMRLAPAEVVAELEKAGFAAEIAEETLPRQYIVVGTKSAQ